MRLLQNSYKNTHKIKFWEEIFMYCSKCGLEVRDGDAFCTKCGSRIAPQQQNLQQGVLVDNQTFSSQLMRGSVIEFGRYHQTASEIYTSPISWIVLDVNADANEALLISKDILDGKRYNGAKQAVTWKDSEIRKWLNTDFFNRAFNSEEKQKIIKTQCAGNGVDSKNDLPQTDDNVFLLNTQEAIEMGGYLIGQSESTDYTKAMKPDGCCVWMYGWMWDKKKAARWWLRNRGIGGSCCAAYYHNNGSVYAQGHDVNEEHYGVRPSIRIRHQSEDSD